jgi:hypothetical protein
MRENQHVPGSRRQACSSSSSAAGRSPSQLFMLA